MARKTNFQKATEQLQIYIDERDTIKNNYDFITEENRLNILSKQISTKMDAIEAELAKAKKQICIDLKIKDKNNKWHPELIAHLEELTNITYEEGEYVNLITYDGERNQFVCALLIIENKTKEHPLLIHISDKIAKAQEQLNEVNSSINEIRSPLRRILSRITKQRQIIKDTKTKLDRSRFKRSANKSLHSIPNSKPLTADEIYIIAQKRKRADRLRHAYKILNNIYYFPEKFEWPIYSEENER